MTEEKVPKQEQSIELLSFDPIVCLRDVLRRWYVIAALALIAALGAYAGSEATYTPRYTTTTTFVVTMQDSSSSVYQNLSATSNLAAVFSEILNSSVLRKTVVETLGIPAFHGSIEASAVAETNLLTMRVTDRDPRTAFLVTNAIIDCHSVVTQQVIGDMVLEVLQSPTVPSAPSNPLNAADTAKKAALLTAAGMCVLLFMISLLRDAVRSVGEAERKLDCRVLVEIRHERKYRTLRAALRRKKSSILITEPLTSFSYTETIRTLRRKLEQHMPESGSIVMITSALENEGKSTIAVNLALSMAQKHRRVLLIDCDLRMPACGKILDIDAIQHETLDVLRGLTAPDEAVIQIPEASSLSLLLQSQSVRNSGKFIGSKAMAALLADVRTRYDYVILDTPPMSAVSDAEALADLADASVLVVRQNQAGTELLRTCVGILQSADGKLLGCVLNDSRTSILSEQSGYGYGYGYGYGRYGHYGKYGRYGKYGAYDAARKSGR